MRKEAGLVRPVAGPSPEAEEGKLIKEPQEVTRKPRELCLRPGVLAGSPGVVAPSRCVDWHLSVTWCGASGLGHLFQYGRGVAFLLMGQL